MGPDSSLDLSDHQTETSLHEKQTHVHWSDVATASPYFTELESARYCRCGVARLRSWEDRGYVTVRVDVDGRRFYVRDELDRVMQGLVEDDGPSRSGPRASGGPKSLAPAAAPAAEPPDGREAATGRAKTTTEGPPKGKKRGRPALPYTDPEKRCDRRGKGGGR